MSVVHVSTRTPHRTGLQGRPHTLGDSTSHTTRHYSGIPHTQIFPTKHTPALLGKRWHPAHPRMYRCRPAAAAPLTLPISNPSDVGFPRSTRDACTHTLEPSPLARAPPPVHTSSATFATPLPLTQTLVRRRPLVRFVARSLTASVSLIPRAHPPLSPPSPVTINPRAPATHSLRIRDGDNEGSEGSRGSGGSRGGWAGSGRGDGRGSSETRRPLA